VAQEINTDNQRTIIRTLAKQFGVKVFFCKTDNCAGYWTKENPDHIYISGHIRWGHSYIEIFFHELGHRHCYYKKIFPLFHRKTYTTLAEIAPLAYRAENFVDRWAERECKKILGNDFYWKGAYRDDIDRKWLLERIRQLYND
jgi:hypothetical protein